MPTLATLAFWELLILLGGFFGIVIWKVVKREIKLDYLLWSDHWSGDEQLISFSPGRAQLLMVTIIFSVFYFSKLIDDPTQFPQMPQGWIEALTGSQVTYLGAKAYTMNPPEGGAGGSAGSKGTATRSTHSATSST